MARARSYAPATVEKTEGAVYRVAVNPVSFLVAVLSPGEDPAPGFIVRARNLALSVAERQADLARRLARASA